MSETTKNTRVIWNTAGMLTLGVIDRFRYNRRRYALSGLTKREWSKLADDTGRIIMNVHLYRNLIFRMTDSTRENSLAAAIVLINRIDNDLYELHHNLLEYDPDVITNVILIIDSEREKWDIGKYGEEDEFPDLEITEESLYNLWQLRRFFLRKERKP
jgi:hypothetical protein